MGKPDLYRVQTKRVVGAVFVRDGIIVDSAMFFKRNIGQKFTDFVNNLKDLESYSKVDWDYVH